MKKVLFILIAFVVLASAFGFQAGPAKAAGLITYVDGRFIWHKGVVFVFDASGFRNRDVRDASMFVGSNFHDLSCTVNKERTRIVCVGGGNLTEFAGQTGIIHLAGQLFYVTIPDRVLPPAEEGNPPLVCGEFETTGAIVTLYYAEGQPDIMFVSGSSIADVQQTAQNWMDNSEGYITDFEIVSDLQCGQIPT